MKYLLILLSLFFLGCRLENCFEEETQVQFCLPEISDIEVEKWKVTVISSTGIEKFEIREKRKFSLTCRKNELTVVKAVPVTESCVIPEDFFKPCGTIYPFEEKLSFAEGFVCQLYEELFLHIEDLEYLETFNWGLLLKTVKNKSAGKEFYNPWNCDRKKILEAVTERAFSSTLLKQTGIYNVQEEYFNCAGTVEFFEYIPCNKYFKENKQVPLKKGQFYRFIAFDEEKKSLVTCNTGTTNKISLVLNLYAL